ncbi:phosphodiester glycosidase family protein [Paenibacillus sediminis]|uniref:Exopolysaccharide biosynthesis protein n=1 Tax=Paenibacillus sediminis TaxID=664909 RepID=A0ABS4H7X6_9BACL|nr:phosphodiester glycosidase family protein [Paenibacillus sediminis]MBP1938643.1 exopolysaccharide biosynthesis protein [Paenibacillus sediminis]
MMTRMRIEKLLSIFIVISLFLSMNWTSTAAAKAGMKVENKKVSINGKSFTVQTVTIPKGTPVTLGLAKGQVGQTAPFASIVKMYQAEAAINGAFFEAYHGAPDPYGTLIRNGQIAHIGRYGTTIGFLKDGTALMDSLMISITGTVTGQNGRSQGWYATFVNRTPADGASTDILFNSARGGKVGFKGGTAVVIENGKVTKKTTNINISIPRDGYVLVYTGTQKSRADRFEVGDVVKMTLSYKDSQGHTIPWDDVVTAVGAGPRLVKDGKVQLNPEAEGFKDEKILKNAAARSAIGIKEDGSIVIATVSGVTMKQWAAVMQKLGVKQAMNLDGGASSALYAGGTILTKPGRELSNTLVFGSKVNGQAK